MSSLDHIAIIVSSEASLLFYEKLGFKETNRFVRSYDTVVIMKSDDAVLEVFVDPNHPQRMSKPEANGLRHIAFCVEDLSQFEIQEENIKNDWFGRRFAFIYDPDGQPIELIEKK